MLCLPTERGATLCATHSHCDGTHGTGIGGSGKELETPREGSRIKSSKRGTATAGKGFRRCSGSSCDMEQTSDHAPMLWEALVGDRFGEGLLTMPGAAARPCSEPLQPRPCSAGWLLSDGPTHCPSGCLYFSIAAPTWCVFPE